MIVRIDDIVWEEEHRSSCKRELAYFALSMGHEPENLKRTHNFGVMSLIKSWFTSASVLFLPKCIRCLSSQYLYLGAMCLSRLFEIIVVEIIILWQEISKPQIAHNCFLLREETLYSSVLCVRTSFHCHSFYFLNHAFLNNETPASVFAGVRN